MGVLELVQPAGVVEMQVGEDAGIDALGRDPDRSERRRRLDLDLSIAVRRVTRFEAGVD